MVFSNRTIRARVTLAALMLASSPIVFADSVVELRTLVGANDSAAAWSMAQRMAGESSGDPEFDFWYGLAAKSAGLKNEAMFAFERVLVVQPENARAKLELADVHFQFGNAAEARVLFDEVLASNPPEPVQQKIRTYLGALAVGEQSKKSKLTYTVGLGAGHDSNIGSSTDIALHDTFVGPSTLLLAASALPADAAFIEAKAGVDYVSPVSQRTLRFLSASAQRRDNEDIFSGGNFDNTQLSLSGGWMLRRGTATWRIPLGVQALWAESIQSGAAPVNDDRFLFSVGAEYSKPLSSRTSMAWYGRLGDSHYVSDADRSTYQVMAGGSYSWTADQAPISVTGSLTLSTEPAQEDTVPASNSEKEYIAAARATLRWSLKAANSLTFGLGAQRTQYRQAPSIYPVGSPDRSDLLTDVAVGWQWLPEKNWTLNADVSVMQNDAQLYLFDFDRTQFRLGSTWRF